MEATTSGTQSGHTSDRRASNRISVHSTGSGEASTAFSGGIREVTRVVLSPVEAMAVFGAVVFLTAYWRRAGANQQPMIQDLRTLVRRRFDFERSIVRGQYPVGAVLGLLAATISVGYAVARAASGNGLTGLGLTSVVLGGVLSATLLIDRASGRLRSVWAKSVVLPSMQLLVTYSLAGIFLVTVFGGFVAVGVVSGLLLGCGFSAIIVTASPLVEVRGGTGDRGHGDMTGVDANADGEDDGTYTDGEDEATYAGEEDDGATCPHCGERVALPDAVPDRDGNLCHLRCRAAADEKPQWFVES